jgi:hypothetical protein
MVKCDPPGYLGVAVNFGMGNIIQSSRGKCVAGDNPHSLPKSTLKRVLRTRTVCSRRGWPAFFWILARRVLMTFPD